MDDPRSTTTLVVNVQDRNDFAPLFGTLPSRAIRLQNTATIGQVVATVSAVDADGTSPNNIVSSASYFVKINQDVVLT